MDRRGGGLEEFLACFGVLGVLIVEVGAVLSVEVGIEGYIVVSWHEISLKSVCHGTAYYTPAITILLSKSASSIHFMAFCSSEKEPWFVMSPAWINTSPLGSLNGPPWPVL